jgi:peptide subunit release factor 1 (eRF1)
MEMGAAETLVVWENLEVERCILKNSSTGEEVIKYLTREQQAKSDAYRFAPPDSLLLVICRRWDALGRLSPQLSPQLSQPIPDLLA